ncbi:MAG: hypothetical protein HN816_01520 [Gammaproteobacteria bacterium]|nr:hypothetical protein [Gammaproteobacteria bacterium]
MKTKLYLDVDGVLLRRTGQKTSRGLTEFQIANHATAFLSFCTEHFDCWWLTVRSREGNITEVERAFRHAVRNPAASEQERDDLKVLVSGIPMAAWGETKADAFSADEDFYWIDDNPDPVSKSWLDQHDLSGRLIVAATDRRPDDLNRVKGVLLETGSSFKKPEFVRLSPSLTKDQMKENIIAALERSGIAVKRDIDPVTGEKIDD